ncbi:MAG: undecaprenyl/decaprenyl-phosphate alpha-N-acetylglucosaminyl 1-phosphate transferase [Patescibacteria group bacterium]|nr:undecaprenyl/decaprenyl-phosphate alpha-N-acetylglucosaminyl 1-phosphate transferase [Patescibacteria group bacterium]
MQIFSDSFNLTLPLVVAFLITAFTTPFCIYFLKKLNIVDDPKTHKHPGVIHKKPIPRGGGIPLFAGVFVAAIIFIPLNQTTVMLFSASLIALVVGVLDDKFDLSPYLRFFMNIAVSLIVVASGINIPFITNPAGGILHFDTINTTLSLFGVSLTISLADVIAVFWITWVMNMLNWSKGVDGQMPGIVAISAIVIGILSLRFPLSDPNTLISANLSFAIAGAALGFLIFNFYPAKIFPGYGATSLYLLLAATSMLSGAKLATAILVMGIPMIDGVFTIFRRILSGRSPFWHDNKHLHHILLNLGLGQRQIALFYWIFSAILGAISLTLTSKGKIFAILMLIVIVGGLLLFLHLSLEKDEKEII